MRLFGVAIVFCVFAFLSAKSWADEDPARFTKQLKQTSEYLKRQEQEAQQAFKLIDQPVPEAVTQTCKELSASLAQMQEKAKGTLSPADIEAIKAVQNSAQASLSALNCASNSARMLTQAEKEYSFSVNSEYLESYKESLKKTITACTAWLGEKHEGQNEYFRQAEPGQARQQCLRSLLYAMQFQGSLSKGDPNRNETPLPADNPIVKDAADFCTSFISAKKEDLAAIIAWDEGKAARPERGQNSREQSLGNWREIISQEREMLSTVAQFKELESASAYKAYVAAVKDCQALTRQQMEVQNDWQLYQSQAGQQKMRELQRKREEARRWVEETGNALRNNSSNMKQRKQAIDAFNKIPSINDTSYPAQLQAIQSEIAGAEADFDKALAAGNRLAVTEIKGKIATLNIRINLLLDEAQMESGLLSMQNNLKNKIADQAYSSRAKLLSDARIKLSEARAEYERLRIEQQEMSNNLDILRFKAAQLESESQRMSRERDEKASQLRNLMSRVLGDNISEQEAESAMAPKPEAGKTEQ